MKNTIYLNSVNSHIDTDTGVVYTSGYCGNIRVVTDSFSLIDDNVPSQWFDALSSEDNDTVYNVLSKVNSKKNLRGRITINTKLV
jgi:hypothetical protein